MEEEMQTQTWPLPIALLPLNHSIIWRVNTQQLLTVRLCNGPGSETDMDVEEDERGNVLYVCLSKVEGAERCKRYEQKGFYWWVSAFPGVFHRLFNKWHTTSFCILQWVNYTITPFHLWSHFKLFLMFTPPLSTRCPQTPILCLSHLTPHTHLLTCLAFINQPCFISSSFVSLSRVPRFLWVYSCLPLWLVCSVAQCLICRCCLSACSVGLCAFWYLSLFPCTTKQNIKFHLLVELWDSHWITPSCNLLPEANFHWLVFQQVFILYTKTI